MDFAAQLANLEKAASRSSNERKRSPPSSSSHYNRGGSNRNQRPRHGPGSSRPPLEAMERFGYCVDPPRQFVPRPRDKDTIPHICLLAVTIDDLPYEHIWRHWATSTAACHVSLVCHAKYPDRVTSLWLKERLLLKSPRMGRGTKLDVVYHTRTPTWGSVEITRAMLDCMNDGLEIGNEADKTGDARFSTKRFFIPPLCEAGGQEIQVPSCDKFVFISETCLPVSTLEECRDALFGTSTATEEDGKEGNDEASIGADQSTETDRKQSEGSETSQGIASSGAAANAVDAWDVSWLNARSRSAPGTPRNKYEHDQFSGIHHIVHGRYRWKADQWLVLSRRHALAVQHLDGHMARPADQLWNAFAKINASDEMYFPTALAILRILEEEHDRTNANTTSNSGVSMNAKSSQVCKRPVTYTDWSEGMKNPATFSRGPTDFLQVATLARKQQCLFARKFSPQSPTGGATGSITVDEWMQGLQAIPSEKKE